MQTIDYIVILLYITGIAGVSLLLAKKTKSSSDMFAAGSQSPWWVSGLSGFMTMFSAGTFVVWGGIAYKYGFVAVSINMCYGFAAFLVGFFLAARWRKLGVDSASEFLRLRFGGSIVQFYTWFQGTIGIFSIGGAIYALSMMVCALMPLPEGHLLVDPNTGCLSVAFTSIALCVLVVFITFSGGLWAVLITDVLQFIILAVSVIFVVPLILSKAGGWSAFIAKAPEGFTSPVAADFTWWFLAGWIVIHFFKIGSEWAFVQRFTCVPTEKDARKSAFIFGAMYLISPLFWMLPALVYRVLEPDAKPEQSYILACKLVLPAGMMGLMIASMASATASMATTQLNVFAGAFTKEVYQRIKGQGVTDKELMLSGRIITVILGLLLMAGSLLIPRYGYTKFILDITTLLTGPLLLPTIWGLFSKKIGLKAVWITTLTGFACAVLVKFGGNLLPDWIETNRRIAELSAGILLPFAILCILELLEKHEHPGWKRVTENSAHFQEQPTITASTLPTKLVGSTLLIIGLLMAFLALLDGFNLTLALFAATLLTIATITFLAIARKKHSTNVATTR